MFGCLKKYFKRRRGYVNYSAALSRSIEDRTLDRREQDELKKIASEYDLNSEKIKNIHYAAFRRIYDEMISDGRLDSNERAKISELLESLALARELAITDAKLHQKAVIIGYLEEGKFPPIETPAEVNLDEGETFRWAQVAAIVKFKKVTTRLNYTGLSYRIKIAKGLSYQIGSIKPQAVTHETIAQEDAGILWLTDQKIAYRGSRKHFEIPFNKIEHFEYDEGVLKVFKTGRLNPYLVLLHDYEVFMKMASMLI